MARSLPAMVAERLTDAILSGVISPGTRLTEIALAEEHSVSRTTIREALALVEKSRLVQRIPRIGAQVVQVRKGEIQEISDIRAALLGLAIRRAISLEDPNRIAALRNIVKEISSKARNEATTPEGFAESTLEAQERLLDLGNSSWLTEIYAQLTKVSLWDRVIRNRGVSYKTAQRRQESARHWRRILEAIEKKDSGLGDCAAREMLADVARFMNEILPSDSR